MPSFQSELLEEKSNKGNESWEFIRPRMGLQGSDGNALDNYTVARNRLFGAPCDLERDAPRSQRCCQRRRERHTLCTQETLTPLLPVHLLLT